VKFFQFVASLYQFISVLRTNFGQFILIFNKIALLFTGVLIILSFQVSSFSKSNCLNCIANDKWLQFTQP